MEYYVQIACNNLVVQRLFPFPPVPGIKPKTSALSHIPSCFFIFLSLDLAKLPSCQVGFQLTIFLYQHPTMLKLVVCTTMPSSCFSCLKCYHSWNSHTCLHTKLAPYTPQTNGRSEQLYQRNHKPTQLKIFTIYPFIEKETSKIDVKLCSIFVTIGHRTENISLA